MSAAVWTMLSLQGILPLRNEGCGLGRGCVGTLRIHTTLWRDLEWLEVVVPPVVVDAEYLKEIDKARQDLRTLISSRHCGPVLLRLAWLHTLSYDVNSNTGGPNSSMRNGKENFRLNNAIDLCEEIKYKHPKVTYADLYQLAGVVAIEAIWPHH